MTNPEITKPKRARLPSGFTTLRDVFTFGMGIAIIVWEVFVSSEVSEAVLAVGLSMAGLPIVFGADEKRKGDDS